jgi:hypothetical protein
MKELPSTLKLYNYDLTVEWGDNWIMMSDDTVVEVENCESLFGKPLLIGIKFVELSNLHPAPFHSTMLDIYKCKISLELDFWPVEECKHKMYLKPLFGIDQFAVFTVENL